MTNATGALGITGLLTLLGPACTREAAPAQPAPIPMSPAAPSASAAPPAPVAAAINAGRCPAEARIDDGEDGDAKILSFEQRTGSWSTYQGKGGSTLEPAAGAPFVMARGGA